MAKDNRESDTSIASQSKRPATGQHDSDSQGADQAQHQHPYTQPQQHRSKAQKHVVGGSRLHARVPSSKALHKHGAASTSKLNRRQASPSPDRAGLTTAIGHRRAVSDVRLSRDSSYTNIKKNTSQSSLKRNRSHADVAKKNKSSSQLHDSPSHSEANKVKPAKGQVHFNLGDDGQEDEWIDASTSASPYLSRRTSVNSSASAKAHGTSADNPAARSETISEGVTQEDSPDREILQHKEYLTSRLLQRAPSQSAPPKMSAETASVTPQAPQRHRSPDSNMSHESTSTLSGTPSTAVQHVLGSNGQTEVTSRFITNASQDSGGGGSFYTSGGSSRPSTGTTEDVARRHRSVGSIAQSAGTEQSTPTQTGLLPRGEDRPSPADEEGYRGVEGSALASSARKRRPGNAAPPAEKSRTQQKLNLQRASSAMEQNHNSHGMVRLAAAAASAAGPLVGGAGFDDRDPRVGKLLERTGLEYLIVRRYQNPVARSLARLSQLPGADKGVRIPKSGATTTGGGGHSKRTSVLSGGGQYGLSQSYHSRDRPATSGGHGPTRQPVTPKRAFSTLRANGASSSFEPEEESNRMHDGLSGSSLVNGEDDDGTLALLRALWEKNLDLSASQD
ncbi:hypothetical protein NKR23_g3022 [Pleurostoma richardsiae]|uniref:Uncharacterized protein n=1 Tax=Pleurostoma richardsiae TaxID=41990 RepID=A0AA38RNI2_9PEZI|nr:hypothetical protein NKR23_g3022 [Pleurostoma richardsiae]